MQPLSIEMSIYGEYSTLTNICAPILATADMFGYDEQIFWGLYLQVCRQVPSVHKNLITAAAEQKGASSKSYVTYEKYHLAASVPVK